jgi:type VII secretion protein EccB
VATRKDQLDAFNFARRRTVANLVAPSATGSDEGAPRPVRTFASSIILSAIAVAAVAVLGVFKPAAPSGWQGGLAVDSSTGAVYIDQNNELHSVYNITSARLILGTKFAKYDVPDSTLNNSGIPLGSPVGILGAPEDVPAAANMNLTQWSFCQNEKGTADETTPGGSTYLEVGYWPAASSTQGLWTSSSDVAMIVHDTAGNVYLIDGDYQYLVGQGDSTNVQNYLSALGDNSAQDGTTPGYWVSDTWLSAFPKGSPLGYPTLADDDLNATPKVSDQMGVVGQYGQFGDQYLVQTANGVAELDPFLYDLYKENPALRESDVQPLPQNLSDYSSALSEANQNSGGEVSLGNAFAGGSYSTTWPQLIPKLEGLNTTDAAAQNVCVGYDYTGTSSVGQLTTWLSAQLPYGTPGSQFGLNQTGSNTYADIVLVKPGYGVIAQSANGSTGSGVEYLIEDSGYRYGLLSSPGSSADSAPVTAVQQLGYSGISPEPVPGGFLNLIEGGISLSPAAAGQTPSIANLG